MAFVEPTSKRIIGFAEQREGLNLDFDSGAKRDDFVELYSGRRPKQLNLSTGETMELSTVWCDEGLNGLRFELAGGHG